MAQDRSLADRSVLLAAVVDRFEQERAVGRIDREHAVQVADVTGLEVSRPAARKRWRMYPALAAPPALPARLSPVVARSSRVRERRLSSAPAPAISRTAAFICPDVARCPPAAQAAPGLDCAKLVSAAAKAQTASCA